MSTKNQYSVSLDGSTDAFSIADHSDFKPTGNFTVGCWVKIASISADQRIFNSWAGAGSKFAGISFLLDYTAGGTYITLQSAKNTGTTVNTDYKQIGGATNIADGEWHFVVGTWDGSYLHVYVDGVEDATAVAWANAPVYQETNYIRIGCYSADGANSLFINGNLNGVFLVNGTAWTQAQAATYMYQDINGATNLKAYYKFQNNANDSSGLGHDLTDIGTPTYSSGVDDVPFTYYLTTAENLTSIVLDGTDDALSIADHADLKPTGSFTVGGWIKSSTIASGAIFQSYSLNTNHAGFRLDVSATTGYAQLLSGKNSGTTENVDFGRVIGTTNVMDGKWHFVVGTSDGIHLKLYVDGVQEGGDKDWASNPVYAATNYVRVGCRNGAGTDANFINGKLDGVFLINGTAWSQATILSYTYQRIPTSTTNLKLLLTLDGVLTDSSGNSHDASLISVPYYNPDCAFDVFNRRSVKLTGSNYLTYPTWRPTIFSISAWIKPNSIGNNQIVGMDGTFVDFSLEVDGTNDDKLGFRVWTGSGYEYYKSTSTITANVWTFVAISYNSSTKAWAIYIGTSGTADNSGTGTLALSWGSASNGAIGATYAGNGKFVGLIDDVRFYDAEISGANLVAKAQEELVGDETNLYSYYKLNGNFIDITTNSKHLTLVSSPTFRRIVPFDDSISIIIREPWGMMMGRFSN